MGMPNWCSNVLAVLGTPSDVDAFVEDQARKAQALSEDGRRADCGALSLHGLVPLVEEGGSAGVDAQVSAWGTKWDLSDVPDPDRIPVGDGLVAAVYHFETAWAPPEAAVGTYFEQHPHLAAVLSFREPGMAVFGVDLYGSDGIPTSTATEGEVVWSGTSAAGARALIAEHVLAGYGNPAVLTLGREPEMDDRLSLTRAGILVGETEVPVYLRHRHVVNTFVDELTLRFETCVAGEWLEYQMHTGEAMTAAKSIAAASSRPVEQRVNAVAAALMMHSGAEREECVETARSLVGNEPGRAPAIVDAVSVFARSSETADLADLGQFLSGMLD